MGDKDILKRYTALSITSIHYITLFKIKNFV